MYRLIISVFSLFITGSVSYPQEWFIRTFISPDERPLEEVRDIKKTGDEAIWFATFGNGIARLKGYEWKVFTTEDGLSSNFVPSIEVDGSNGIWAATDHGISHISENGAITRYSKDDIPIMDVLWLNEVKRLNNGEIWFGSQSGSVIGCVDSSQTPSIDYGKNIIEVDNKKWFIVKPPSVFSDHVIYEIYEDEKNDIWIAADLGGIYRFIDSRWQQIEIPINFGRVHSVTQDSTGKYWLIGGELVSYGKEGWLEEKKGVSGVILASSSRGEIFVPGYAGLHYQTGNDWKMATYPNDVGNPKARVIFMGDERHGWIGTKEGVLEIVQPKFLSVNHSEITFDANDSNFFASPKIQPLAVNNNNQLIQYAEKEWVPVLQLPGELSRPRRLTQVVNGKVWVQSGNTFYRISLEEKIISETANKPEPFRLNGIFYSTKEQLRIFGKFGGYILKNGNWIPFPKTDNQEAEEIVSISETHDGDLLICKRTSVERWSGGVLEQTWENSTVSDRFPLNFAVETSDERIWTGSQWLGLFIHEGESQKNITIADDVKSNIIKGLYESLDGTIWVGTEHQGLSAYKNNCWINYSHKNGIGNAEFGSIAEHPEGVIWMSSHDNNIYRYIPEKNPPDTLIRKSFISIPHSSFGIFTYDGYDFWNNTPRHELLYSTRIVRLDREEVPTTWSKFAPSESFKTPGLHPGRYRFEVRAIDMDFNIDPTPDRREFTVLPVPVESRAWFIPSIAIVFLIIIFLTISTVVSRGKLAVHTDNLEIEVEHRTSDLRMEVNERKKAQESLKNEKNRIEASAQAKGQFLANMSHEIRTPIHGIIGLTEITLDTQLTVLQRKYINRIHDSSDALLAIINDILNFSKMESGMVILLPEEFGLRDCVCSIIQTLTLRAKNDDIELLIDIPPDIPERLIGDKSRFQQILNNVIGNALKFTEQGEICVQVRTASLTEKSITLEFSLIDTGIGIPEEKHDLIFHEFEQADLSSTRQYGGTGLGLAISQNLVKLLGGSMRVESPRPGWEKDSKGGPGSVFHFTSSFELNLLNSEEKAATSEFERKRVLIVDDNELNRIAISDCVHRLSMESESVAGGEEAIESIKESLKEEKLFDVVLIDSQIPGIEEFSLVNKINEIVNPASVNILILSTSEYQQSIEQCRSLGIKNYLLKPVKQSDLYNALTSIYGESSESVKTTTSKAEDLVNPMDVSLRILLVEDNEINQMVVKDRLEKWNHSVRVANDGMEGLAVLEKGTFDLVLMDVNMPKLDGIATTRKIREKEQGTGQHIPIIAMTAAAMIEDREKCLDSGMDDYIAKPVKAQELIETIASVFKQQIQRAVSSRDNKVDEPNDENFDKETLLLEVDGNREMLWKMMELLRRKSPEQVKIIREAVEKRDKEEFFQAVHSLKGMFAEFHADKARKAAQDLERLKNDLSFGKIEELIERVETESNSLMQALNATFGKN